MKHVFFIICDELRYDALSCHGNPYIKTPNLDSLAKDSICFLNNYCDTPMCVPSRVSLATGRYALCHGAMDNMLKPLPDENSLYSELQYHGVHTVNYGKWHTNMPPDVFGLDVCEDGLNLRISPEKFISPFGLNNAEARTNVHYKRNYGEIPLVLYGRRPNAPDQTLDSLVTDAYLEELDRIAQSDTPTFARLSILDPHSPYFPAGKYADMVSWQDIELPENFRDGLETKPLLQRYFYTGRGFDLLTEEDYKKFMAAYYGLVAHVDDRIGKVIAKLKALNLYDDSLIVFTSDHGCMLGEHGFVEKWGHMYDQVEHCPLFFKMPGNVGAGRSEKTFVQTLDIMPTILDWYGIPVPENVHGISLLPVLEGRHKEVRSKVFAQYYCGSIQCEPAVMVRDHNYKLTLYPGQKSLEKFLYLDHPLKLTDFFDGDVVPGELYDLKKDPAEQNNLFKAPAMASVVQRYKGYIEQWKQEIGPLAQIPEHQNIGKIGMFVFIQGGNLERASKFFDENGRHVTYTRY